MGVSHRYTKHASKGSDSGGDALQPCPTQVAAVALDIRTISHDRVPRGPARSLDSGWAYLHWVHRGRPIQASDRRRAGKKPH